MKRIVSALALLTIAGCGHELTPPGTFNGEQLTQTLTITVKNWPEAEAPPNIDIKVVGELTQESGNPLKIYAVSCDGKYKQIYLEGIGVFQCDTAGGEVSTVELPGHGI